MKKVLPLMLMVILILTGTGLLFYPQISNFAANFNRQLELVEYDDDINQMEQELINIQWEKVRAYNQQIHHQPFTDPFAYFSQEDLDKDYVALLNTDGIMGRVFIPSIGVNLPIYHGIAEEVICKGAGHLPGSSLPAGGDSVHAVLTSHSGLPQAKLFTSLERMEIGDLFYIYVLDEVLAYQVDQILVVEPNDTEALRIVEGENYVTLITCTPHAINSHRLLVRGNRLELTQEKAARLHNQVSQNWRHCYKVIIGIAAAVIFIFILLLLWRRKRRKTKEISSEKGIK